MSSSIILVRLPPNKAKERRIIHIPAMEYTVICALDNARIAYVNEAISSDQFVSRLKLSMTQRVRWSYGMFQCIKYYEGNLIKQAFKGSHEAFDLDPGHHFLPVPAPRGLDADAEKQGAAIME